MLVATTVIEVGVDVPNATVMIVEDAERFGLAQLHQLRGRVGRGEHPGELLLFADPRTEEGRRRMAAFVSTTDGFELAEEDLRLRGEGQVLGERQHGLPELRLASVVRDTRPARRGPRGRSCYRRRRPAPASTPQHAAARRVGRAAGSGATGSG